MRRKCIDLDILHRRSTRFLIALGVGGAALGAVSAAGAFQGSDPSAFEVWKSFERTYNTPGTPSWGQVEDLVEAAANNSSLPAGHSLNQDLGLVRAVVTGIVSNQGEPQVSVTLVDDIADVDIARFFVNDVVVAIATRANLGIVDRVDKAYATLTAFVPTALPYSLRVQWEAAGKQSLDRTIHLQ